MALLECDVDVRPRLVDPLTEGDHVVVRCQRDEANDHDGHGDGKERGCLERGQSRMPPVSSKARTNTAPIARSAPRRPMTNWP